MTVEFFLVSVVVILVVFKCAFVSGNGGGLMLLILSQIILIPTFRFDQLVVPISSSATFIYLFFQ